MSNNHIYNGPKNNKDMLEHLQTFATFGTDALRSMAREFNLHVARQADAEAYRQREKAKAVPARANQMEAEFFAVLRAGFAETASSEFDARWPAPEVPEMIDLSSLEDFEAFGESENARLAKANDDQKAAAAAARVQKAVETKLAQQATIDAAVEKAVADAKRAQDAAFDTAVDKAVAERLKKTTAAETTTKKDGAK